MQIRILLSCDSRVQYSECVLDVCGGRGVGRGARRGARAREAHDARELRRVGGLDFGAPAAEIGELCGRRLLGLRAFIQRAQLLTQLQACLCEMTNEMTHEQYSKLH